jgi:serine/threonine protein kinase
MGNVFLSFTPGGRAVAIKVMRQEFADDPEFRRRFHAEVIAAQRVQGLYTAPVVDADPDAPLPWLATAYIAGPSLQQAVAGYGPFPLLSAFRLLGGVAEGLAAIHAAGLVHRDLKPSNVLLAEDGPRVIDFGIAYAADATTLTSSGMVIGTPAFMAPEQALGKTVTTATDVFALAHLTVFAATGHAAFGEGHQAAVVYRIANEAPNLEDCPDALRQFAERGLAKNPAERPGLAAILSYVQRNLAGNTMQVVMSSWLPRPVAATLDSYDMAPLQSTWMRRSPTAAMPVAPVTVPPDPERVVPPRRRGLAPMPLSLS